MMYEPIYWPDCKQLDKIIHFRDSSLTSTDYNDARKFADYQLKLYVLLLVKSMGTRAHSQLIPAAKLF